MKPDTIKTGILEYLSHGNWQYGGTIGTDVGARLKHKAEIIGRRLREYESGKGSNGKPVERILEKQLVPNPNGKGSPVVQYRLRQAYRHDKVAAENTPCPLIDYTKIRPMTIKEQVQSLQTKLAF